MTTQGGLMTKIESIFHQGGGDTRGYRRRASLGYAVSDDILLDK